MSDDKPAAPADTLTQRIGVLTRRETEARIVAPLIDALAEEFGREKVLAVVRDAVERLAKDQGAELSEAMGGDDPATFLQSMKYWRQDGALEIDVLEQSPEKLDFNVTRCRYAELYRALGIPELGAVLSCNRDFAFAEGFNEDATLTRSQTILSGASHCDFRFRFPAGPKQE